MALPDLDDVKAYLKIPSTITVDDDLLTASLATAFANVQAYVRRPIYAEERTFYLERPSHSLYSTIATLHLPIYPVASFTTLTDVDGNVLVDAVDYRVDLRTGVITGIAGSLYYPFAGWPLIAVAFVGLDARPDYADAVEPVLFGAILDVVADRYQRRNPAATSETTGGGVSTSYGEYGLPTRVCETLKPFQMARVR